MMKDATAAMTLLEKCEDKLHNKVCPLLKQGVLCSWVGCPHTCNIVNRGNGYEIRQSSLLYVFDFFFGLDPAKNTPVVYYWPRT